MHKLTGVITAVVSPMFPDGSLDVYSFRNFIEWQVLSGISGLTVTGTTGEVSTLSYEEHISLVKTTIEQTKGRVPIVVGSGSNSTFEAIHLTQTIKELGADFSLQVVPYYNKPTQEGLYKHFKRIAEAVDMNIILYNVASRTGVGLAVDTIHRLSQIPGIVGIKETSTSMLNIYKLLRLKRELKDKFAVYSGDDSTFLGASEIGSNGVISVISNMIPKSIVNLYLLSRLSTGTKDKLKLNNITSKVFSLCKLMFIETNPIPVKTILGRIGLINSGIRYPLTHLNYSHCIKILKVIRDLSNSLEE